MNLNFKQSKIINMTIFRSRANNRLYIIHELIHDVRFLNRNAFAGIYAIPYKWKGEQISVIGKTDDWYHCFIADNFNAVSHT
jgi:hypothetical protein